MYHYVRPLKNSKYSKIKGLEFDGFIRQINYLNRKFNFIDVEQFLNSIYNDEEIPINSVLLTFDDGLSDHYNYVYPILKKHSIQGLFFPPIQAIEEREILDVHKIQLILAQSKNPNLIIKEIKNFIDKNKEEYELQSFENYFKIFSGYDRFDNKEIVFIKKILQRELPRKLRNELVDLLFKKIVSVNIDELVNKFYLSINELKEMQENGMYIGSHGYSHEWLSNLTNNELDMELKKCIQFSNNIKRNKNDLIMCYPYGDYDKNIIQKLKILGFKAGLTTEVGDAELNIDKAFTIKRFDTNDFPR